MQEPTELQEIKPKRRKRTTPTIKQIKALQFMNMGMSRSQAMRKAGYKENTIHNSNVNLMQTAGVRNALETMAGKLEDAGLTVEYMTNKFKQWLEAEKTVVSHTGPDYTIPDTDMQLKAYKEWKEIMKGTIDNSPKKVRRKLTIEEFVHDGEEE